MASMASSTEKTNSWCTVPKNEATVLAASKSGDSVRPMEKVWRRGDHHEGSVSLASTRLAAILDAMEATSEESRPPLSKTPHGTSDIRRFLTAAVKVARSRSKSTGAGS